MTPNIIIGFGYLFIHILILIFIILLLLLLLSWRWYIYIDYFNNIHNHNHFHSFTLSIEEKEIIPNQSTSIKDPRSLVLYNMLLLKSIYLSLSIYIYLFNHHPIIYHRYPSTILINKKWMRRWNNPSNHYQVLFNDHLLIFSLLLLLCVYV